LADANADVDPRIQAVFLQRNLEFDMSLRADYLGADAHAAAAATVAAPPQPGRAFEPVLNLQHLKQAFIADRHPAANIEHAATATPATAALRRLRVRAAAAGTDTLAAMVAAATESAATDAAPTGDGAAAAVVSGLDGASPAALAYAATQLCLPPAPVPSTASGAACLAARSRRIMATARQALDLTPGAFPDTPHSLLPLPVSLYHYLMWRAAAHADEFHNALRVAAPLPAPLRGFSAAVPTPVEASLYDLASPAGLAAFAAAADAADAAADAQPVLGLEGGLLLSQFFAAMPLRVVGVAPTTLSLALASVCQRASDVTPFALQYLRAVQAVSQLHSFNAAAEDDAYLESMLVWGSTWGSREPTHNAPAEAALELFEQHKHTGALPSTTAAAAAAAPDSAAGKTASPSSDDAASAAVLGLTSEAYAALKAQVQSIPVAQVVDAASAAADMARRDAEARERARASRERRLGLLPGGAAGAVASPPFTGHHALGQVMTLSALARSFLGLFDPESAWDWLLALPAELRGPRTFTALLGVSVRKGTVTELRRVTMLTLARFLSHFLLQNDIVRARQLMAYVVANALPMSPAVYNMWIAFHARNGDVARLRHTLSVMERHGHAVSAPTATVIMQAALRHNDPDLAIAIYRDFIGRNCELVDVPAGSVREFDLPATLSDFRALVAAMRRLDGRMFEPNSVVPREREHMPLWASTLRAAERDPHGAEVLLGYSLQPLLDDPPFAGEYLGPRTTAASASESVRAAAAAAGVNVIVSARSLTVRRPPVVDLVCQQALIRAYVMRGDLTAAYRELVSMERRTGANTYPLLQTYMMLLRHTQDTVDVPGFVAVCLRARAYAHRLRFSYLRSVLLAGGHEFSFMFLVELAQMLGHAAAYSTRPTVALLRRVGFARLRDHAAPRRRFDLREYRAETGRHIGVEHADAVRFFLRSQSLNPNEHELVSFYLTELMANKPSPFARRVRARVAEDIAAIAPGPRSAYPQLARMVDLLPPAQAATLLARFGDGFDAATLRRWGIVDADGEYVPPAARLPAEHAAANMDMTSSLPGLGSAAAAVAAVTEAAAAAIAANAAAAATVATAAADAAVKVPSAAVDADVNAGAAAALAAAAAAKKPSAEAEEDEDDEEGDGIAPRRPAADVGRFRLGYAIGAGPQGMLSGGGNGGGAGVGAGTILKPKTGGGYSSFARTIQTLARAAPKRS
jgi:hypothetical protein